MLLPTRPTTQPAACLLEISAETRANTTPTTSKSTKVKNDQKDRKGKTDLENQAAESKRKRILRLGLSSRFKNADQMSNVKSYFQEKMDTNP